MSQENVDEYEERARNYREAVEPHLGGQNVEAVGEFARPTRFWESSDSFLVRSIARALARDEGPLGELPESFLLALTRDILYALRYRREKGSMIQVEGKVAEFDRNSVRFSKEMGTWAEVAVLELSEEGRKDRIQVKGEVLNSEKNPWAPEVLAALSE